MKLTEPVVYRRLFIGGLLVAGIGAILQSVLLVFAAIILLILSKYGMRKEHKQKKQKGEIR
jgi:hypothetical protein